MKTIAVSDDVWDRLTMLKVKFKFKSYNDLLKAILESMDKKSVVPRDGLVSAITDIRRRVEELQRDLERLVEL